MSYELQWLYSHLPIKSMFLEKYIIVYETTGILIPAHSYSK